MNVFTTLRHWLRQTPSATSPVITRSTLTVCQLEDRTVPSTMEFRTLDGTGNNLTNTEWGSTNEQLLRVATAAYADGISTVGGESRPSARVISNALAAQGELNIPSDRMLSAMVYAWGQFIDHDLGLTDTNGTELLSIPVPTGDEFFDPFGTGTQAINTTRSVYDFTTGTSTSNPREQTSSLTSWIDGSMIYGVDAATSASLRSFVGGAMKTSAGDMLPIDENGNFMTGDSRANENVELTSLHTLFVREHNRVAAEIAAKSPSLSDEEIFQQARSWVIAEIQSITYNEWLPAVLGRDAIAEYNGYDSTVNPTLATEFSSAGFRFGHSLLGNDVEFFDNNGNEVHEAVPLSGAFFNPDLLKETGIDSVLKYLASDPSSEIDTQVVDSVRNFLFGAPGSGGLDLASLNIERGRDHGLADYNTTREAYGLPRVTSFAEITSNTDVQTKLQELYGTVDNIDLWVGILAEDHLSGTSTGITLQTIVADQFTRVRDGDRFWYENIYSGKQLAELQRTSLTDIIQRNSNTTVLQDNTFFLAGNRVSGVAFTDTNRSGILDDGETVLSGVFVFADLNRNGKQDTNEPGMTTAADGTYDFLVPKDGSVLIVAQGTSSQHKTPAQSMWVTLDASSESGIMVDFGFISDVCSMQPTSPKSQPKPHSSPMPHGPVQAPPTHHAVPPPQKNGGNVPHAAPPIAQAQPVSPKQAAPTQTPVNGPKLQVAPLKVEDIAKPGTAHNQGKGNAPTEQKSNLPGDHAALAPESAKTGKKTAPEPQVFKVAPPDAQGNKGADSSTMNSKKPRG